VMNWLDAFIVIISLLELYVLSPLGMEMPNVSIMRLLRLVKLTKVLRIVRVMRFFRELRVLVVSIVASVQALVWSIVLLSLIQFMVAILMTQLLHEGDPNWAPELKAEVHEYFGRWTHSMLTMFEITVAPGAWGKVGRLLIFKVNPGYAVVFYVYIWGVTFAIVRVISALFLKETLEVAGNDEEHALKERTRKKLRDSLSLRRIFLRADKDGSGNLSLQEFKRIVTNERMAYRLSCMGLGVEDINTLFVLLEGGDGEVSMDEFLQGAMRIRGPAKSQDMVRMMYDFSRMLADLKQTVLKGQKPRPA